MALTSKPDVGLGVSELRASVSISTFSSSIVQGRLSVESGQACALVGPSGQGKTLFAKALIGLSQPKLKVTSEIQWKGAALPSLRALLGKTVAYVSQAPRLSLDPQRTVQKQMEEFLRIHEPSYSKAECIEAMGFALDEAGLAPEALHLYPHQLSGGMAQRAVLAFAFLTQVELLIADEPTSALDLELKADLIDTLERRMDQGWSILFITHDLDLVRALAHKAYRVEAGILSEIESTG